MTAEAVPSTTDDEQSAPALSPGVRAYVLGVALLGTAVLVMVCLLHIPQTDWSWRRTGPGYLFAVLLFAGELRRMLVVRRDGDSDRLTVSSTFAVALVLTGPLCLALLSQCAATAVDDLRQRRGALRTAFNVGQYALTLSAVHVAFRVPQAGPLLDVDGGTSVALAPALAGAAAYFVVNNLLVGIVFALISHQSLVEVLREDLRVHGLDSAIMLGLAPIAAVTITHSLAFAPFVVLPLLGVQRNARIASQRQHESLHDDLTGLPNRSLFQLRTERALTQAAADQGRVAVLLVDLDHFKDVNDTLGHHIGDGLLREVAQRLVSALPDLTVARLGGDEFAVLVPDPADREQVLKLAEQAMAGLREPVVAEGIRLGVHASVGFAMFPEDAQDQQTLVQRADIALYRAKENRNEVQSYRPDLDPHSIQRLSLHGDLHAAVDSHELHMVYQPQVDASSGRLVGVEALMRWSHPVHGPISPEVFIPLAESSGLIAPLTRRAVDWSLAAIGVLRRQEPHISIAVNLSARLLADLDVPNWLSQALAETGLPNENLTIEVTESTISADPHRAMLVLAQLREMGVRLAIDDFGTGYSSLSYLTRLQPDEIKIDKSFVQNMRTDANSAVIVRSTIELGHALGLTTVAEGVEDQYTYDALTALGCDRIQGYHVARPMPADALRIWWGTAPWSRWHVPLGPSGRRTALVLGSPGEA
ncbi:MAG TPA: bifunctional diguanylate cyclase/phosphodiesterase [Kineosporiaceae bacterium]|nr:bifunctional diguanylate cyclase/phosphodiesterase [Kineosporiaceae bacterium]